MSTQGFRFGPVLTDKVISVVKRVDDMPYRYGNASVPVRFEDDGGGGGGGGDQPHIRVCTFAGTWLKNADKTVTLTYTSEGEANTMNATNILFDVARACDGAPKKAIIGRDGTAWFLINTEC